MALRRRGAAPRVETTGMEEVLEHESTIRVRLPLLRGDPDLRARAERIMRGRPKVGTRLDALRRIAGELMEATLSP